MNITVTREGSFFPSGDPPSTVTFTEGSSTATLTLATVGDSTLEDHGSVKVAIAEGDDYKVGVARQRHHCNRRQRPQRRFRVHRGGERGGG